MSERYVAPVNVAYGVDFYVFSSANAPVAGLVNANFAKVLKKNGVVNAAAVTVTEHVAADGGYRASYTPDANGNWSLWVTQATHNPRGWQDDLQVQSEDVLAGSKQTGDAYARLGAPAGASIAADIATRLATAGYTAPLDAAGTRAAVGLTTANLDTQLDALPTASENADAVWDENLDAHNTEGTSGALLINASATANDIAGAVAALNDLSSAEVTAAVPTVEQIATAVGALVVLGSKTVLNVLRAAYLMAAAPSSGFTPTGGTPIFTEDGYKLKGDTDSSGNRSNMDNSL